jgi:hypothetical protein
MKTTNLENRRDKEKRRPPVGNGDD